MDAFDYFIVVLVYADIADEFGVSLTRMAFLTTATLIMRPVGAALFGMWADKVGRKRALIVDVSFYSVVGFLCAFSPNYSVLLVLRMLYGIGMGGEWGLGASLAMEKVPARKRGLVSGILQQGYAAGYLLAAVAYLLVRNYTDWGWRGLFALSILPAICRCSCVRGSPSPRPGSRRRPRPTATRRPSGRSCPRRPWCDASSTSSC